MADGSGRLEPIMLLNLPIIAFEHCSKIKPVMLQVMFGMLSGNQM